MNQKMALIKALRILTSTIDGLDDKELEQLFDGKAKLGLLPIDRPSKDTHSASSVLAVSYPELLDRLNGCVDRNQARSVLVEITNKDTLVAFAKTQKIHITKHDRRDDIENKIIEFFVGAKLRTAAIQSLNMAGGTDNQSSE